MRSQKGMLIVEDVNALYYATYGAVKFVSNITFLFNEDEDRKGIEGKTSNKL